MKNLHRFLIPVLFVAALFDAAGWCGFSSKADSAESFKIEKLTFSDTVSTPDSSLSVPRQISSSGFSYLSGGARRTNNAHNRSHSEVVRSGKTFNVSVIYYLQKHSVVVSTSVVEHAKKLVFIGKLLI